MTTTEATGIKGAWPDDRGSESRTAGAFNAIPTLNDLPRILDPWGSHSPEDRSCNPPPSPSACTSASSAAGT